ncbi:hypothetical protein GTO91_01915 [Heliobacterium undosum]|uniref:Uncharacterized protein n=1 Tax=Heliomicrobium undosum TaxID=121734 RepID=A0A845L1X9_9FIRM|nr:hypothetical protein [Heliomicrobium undosum]MZP28480.1 hypothetical protein [Heliomicrobium undosum]
MIYLFFIIAALAMMAATVTAMGNHAWSSVRTQARAEQVLYCAESGIEAALAVTGEWLRTRPSPEDQPALVNRPALENQGESRSDSQPDVEEMVSHLASRLPGLSLGDGRVKLTYRSVPERPFALDIISAAEGDGGRFVMMARVDIEKSPDGPWKIALLERASLLSGSRVP